MLFFAAGADLNQLPRKTAASLLQTAMNREIRIRKYTASH